MILSKERRAALTTKAQRCAEHLDDAMDYLLSRGISREAAEMFGLGFVPHGYEFGGRLAIPYYTPMGVVQIKYRATEPEAQPKYLYEAGLGVHLYNGQSLLQAEDRAVITEGELDALVVQAYSGIPAVGYPGVDTWNKAPHWRMCFEGLAQVFVVADGDKAGRMAAHRVAESIGYTARVVDLPDGHDASSFIQEFGAAAFAARLT